MKKVVAVANGYRSTMLGVLQAVSYICQAFSLLPPVRECALQVVSGITQHNPRCIKRAGLEGHGRSGRSDRQSLLGRYVRQVHQ